MHAQRPKRDDGSGASGAVDGSRERWREAHELAGAQEGVVDRRQLLGLGIERGAIAHRLRTGELTREHRGVYLVGPVRGAKASEMAAVLSCGARSCVSHASAAYLRKLPPYPARPECVHITVVGRDPGKRRGVTVHQVTSLMRDEVELQGRMPVTTPTRTIFDLAPSLTLPELEHLLAQAYAAGATSRPKLLRLLGRYPSRPGTPALRHVLDAETRPARTRSGPERRLLALIRKARLPQPQVNARFHAWEVDFLWPDTNLVVEVDALSTHTSPRDFERDRRKDSELVSRGYIVMRVTRRQLEEEPEIVVARLAAALTRAEVA